LLLRDKHLLVVLLIMLTTLLTENLSFFLYSLTAASSRWRLSSSCCCCSSCISNESSTYEQSMWVSRCSRGVCLGYLPELPALWLPAPSAACRPKVQVIMAGYKTSICVPWQTVSHPTGSQTSHSFIAALRTSRALCFATMWVSWASNPPSPPGSASSQPP